MRIPFIPCHDSWDSVSDVFWYEEGRAITAVAVAQEAIGFVIVFHLLSLRIEIQRSSESIGGVR